MALKATIFKAELQVADVERNYYAGHSLTIARHPSETDERMMVRLLAFALHADEALGFAGGLADEDEPDLWKKDLTGAILMWIEVGLPEAKRVRKACGRAERVVVYSYGRGAPKWWGEVAEGLARPDNLGVVELPEAATKALARLAQRSMQLTCTINDGQIWLSDATQTVQVEAAVRRK